MTGDRRYEVAARSQERAEQRGGGQERAEQPKKSARHKLSGSQATSPTFFHVARADCHPQ